MKNLFKALCSVFFVTTMAFPADALTSPAEEVDEATEKQAAQTATSDNYHLAFLTGDFGLQHAGSDASRQVGPLVMFLSGPDGKIVKEAQVVTTIIDACGNQSMQRARPLKGGYLVETAHLAPGQYRLETEIIVDGWLLTDEMTFQKV